MLAGAPEGASVAVPIAGDDLFRAGILTRTYGGDAAGDEVGK